MTDALLSSTALYLIRPSSLPTWADCARRTAARLFPALVRGAGYELRSIGQHVGANVGSGVHAGAAYTLDSKRTDGTLGHYDEAIDRAMEEFDRRTEEDGCSWDDTTNNRSTAQKQIRRMTFSYRDDIAPTVTPILVETRRNADLGDGFEISGQLDLLAVEDQRLRDLKTGAQRRANGAQYGSYSLIFRANGYQVDAVAEDFLPRVRVTKPQPPAETHPIPIDAAEVEAVETIADIKRSVAEFVRRVDNPDGPPPAAAFRANPYSMLCTDRFCPAWGTSFCRAHKGAQ